MGAYAARLKIMENSWSRLWTKMVIFRKIITFSRTRKLKITDRVGVNIGNTATYKITDRVGVVLYWTAGRIARKGKIHLFWTGFNPDLAPIRRG